MEGGKDEGETKEKKDLSHCALCSEHETQRPQSVEENSKGCQGI